MVSNALQIIRVAFIIGVKVDDAARRFSTGTNQSWSRLVANVQHEALEIEIGKFNGNKVRLTITFSPFCMQEFTKFFVVPSTFDQP